MACYNCCAGAPHTGSLALVRAAASCGPRVRRASLLLAVEFHSYEGSHILLALRVKLAASTSRPEACAIWDAFVSLEEEGAAACVGTSAAVSLAAAGPEAKTQLFMVFAELVNCWGMIMSGGDEGCCSAKWQ